MSPLARKELRESDTLPRETVFNMFLEFERVLLPDGAILLGVEQNLQFQFPIH